MIIFIRQALIAAYGLALLLQPHNLKAQHYPGYTPDSYPCNTTMQSDTTEPETEVNINETNLADLVTDDQSAKTE